MLSQTPDSPSSTSTSTSTTSTSPCYFYLLSLQFLSPVSSACPPSPPLPHLRRVHRFLPIKQKSGNEPEESKSSPLPPPPRGVLTLLHEFPLPSPFPPPPDFSSNFLSINGKFRIKQWKKETKVDESLFPKGEWIEELDSRDGTNHYIIMGRQTEEDGEGVSGDPTDTMDPHGWYSLLQTAPIVASCRLTYHTHQPDNPDGPLFLRVPKSSGHYDLPQPSAHFCKLIVDDAYRGNQLGYLLNWIRIYDCTRTTIPIMDAGKTLVKQGIKCIILTASEANWVILKGMGFQDCGVREEFNNRPGVVFRAIIKYLE